MRTTFTWCVLLLMLPEWNSGFLDYDCSVVVCIVRMTAGQASKVCLCFPVVSVDETTL